MKKKRLVKRNLNFQKLDARLAFDADSIDFDPQIAESLVADSETVELSSVDWEAGDWAVMSFSSVEPIDAVLDVEQSDIEPSDVELRAFELQRSNDPIVDDIDEPVMTVGFLQFDFDTNNDGTLAAADALLVINAINARNLGPFAIAMESKVSDVNSSTEVSLEFDTNRDGELSPIDALLIINALNLQSSDSEPSVVAENSSKFAAIRPDDLTAQLDSDDTAAVSDAIMAAPIEGIMRVAGSTEVKVDGVNGLATILLSFDEEGEVVATSAGEDLEVTIDKDDAVAIEGIKIPVAVASLGGSQLFVPYPIEDESISISWPWSFDVDNAFAAL